MSFLGNIVSSIGGDRAPPPPTNPPNRIPNANAVRTPGTAPRPGLQPVPNIDSPSALKRKANDTGGFNDGKIARLNGGGDVRDANRKAAAPPLHGPKAPSADPRIATARKEGPSSRPSSSNGPVSRHTAPTKGSYAELMARAKETAEQRSQSQIGVIKHEERRKGKMSKLAERRRAEQDKAKGVKSASSDGSRVQAKPTKSTSPAKKIKDRKPTSATVPVKATYKGTMGTTSSRSRHNQGRPERMTKYEEYLATDEEDASDLVHDEEDYASDASSDMEAGLNDLDLEEQRALREAKQDDAREAAIENTLKREKEERRQKLTAMAKKQR